MRANSEWLNSIVRSAESLKKLAKDIDVSHQAYGGDKLQEELRVLVKELRRYQREMDNN